MSDRIGIRPFALVLSGGGARGLAHAGVIRALEHYGYRPSAVVGVSMGAVVGATYGLNPDWYEALLNMDTSGFPDPPAPSAAGLRQQLRLLPTYSQAAWSLVAGWGVGQRALPYGMALLERLTLGRALEDSRIPVAAIASDLISGDRAVLREGRAAEALYASAALAGILPPLERDGKLLADGAYADIAPIDVARALLPGAMVVAVNPHEFKNARPPRNGLQALVRALEVCHQQHAHVRFAEADVLLEPQFPFPIDTLDFGHKRVCVAAGARAVRAVLPRLRELLGAAPTGV
ncbi:MAG: patatin-like phospholipase family protein [Meiothermus sp.]|nr:patatin-like phospholipase family protein [Meiothermus sp.]